MRHLLLAAAALCVSTLSAHADTFNFVVAGAGFSASGQITGNADPTTAGAFDISSGTVTVNGVAGTLHTPGTTAGSSVTYQAPNQVPFNDQYSYNNVVYPGATPALDEYGLLFDVGSDHYNFYYLANSYQFSTDEIENGVPATFTLSTVTPEPSSIALLGTGLLGVIGAARKRLN